MRETNSYMACEDLVAPLLSDYPDKKSLAYAYICGEAGAVYTCAGRTVLAFDVIRTNYDIRRANPLAGHPYDNETALGYDLMCLAYTGIWQFKKAIEWIDEAIECVAQQQTLQVIPEEQIGQQYDADQFWRNRARVHYYLGRYAAARNDLGHAEKWQELKYGARS